MREHTGEGERFTERRNFYHKPIANINWDFNINDSMDLSTVMYGSWGRGGGTGGYGRGRVRYEDSQPNGNRPGHEIDFDAIQTENIANADANGHGNFEYEVPSGYFALCTKNLAEYG